jgi:mono/diheme cytochrome c family protein
VKKLRLKSWIASRTLPRVAGIGAIFLLCLAFSSCLVQTDNSVNGDKQAFGNPPSGSTNFAAASAIFKQNCMPCHASNYASWTEGQFVTSGAVIPQQPMNSRLYQRLRGSNAGGAGPEDMPQNGAALSPDDLQTIRTWIQGISGAVPSPSPSPSEGTPEARTAAALAVISNDCADCHGDPKTANSSAFNGQTVPAFAGFTTDEEFTSSGIVVIGNAQSSWLIRALKTYGDLNLMPTDDGAIPAADAAALQVWIENLDPSDPLPAPSPTPTPSPSPSASSGTLNAAGRTAAALAVLSNECSDCHGGTKTATSAAFNGKTVAAFTNFTADSDFTGAGLVSSGDAQNSWLIRALKGTGDINSMPTDSGAIPAAEVTTLESWITNLGKP